MDPGNCFHSQASISDQFHTMPFIAIHTIFTRNDTKASINFTAVEGGDNSSYAGSEAREVFINSSSDNSGVNK